MPKFDLVGGVNEQTGDALTLVRITEGEFSGVLIDIDEVKVTADQQLSFTYNLYEYAGEKPNMDRLDKVVEEIVYVVLENYQEDDL